MVSIEVQLGSNPTFADLASITLALWQGMPTIGDGHTDNLKYEGKDFRVWVSRMTLADYDGNAQAYSDERMTIEQRIGGTWVALDRYGRRKEKDHG